MSANRPLQAPAFTPREWTRGAPGSVPISSGVNTSQRVLDGGSIAVPLNGTVSVSFGSRFSVAPTVTANVVGGTTPPASPGAVAAPYAVTAKGFSLLVHGATAIVTVHWQAVS